MNPDRFLGRLFAERSRLRRRALDDNRGVELDRGADQLRAARQLRLARMRGRDGLGRLAMRIRDDLRRQPFGCGDLVTPQCVGRFGC